MHCPGVALSQLANLSAVKGHSCQSFAENLYRVQGKDEYFATLHDYYMAVAHSIRDRLTQRRIQTAKTYVQQDAKTVYYLSAEFLMGRHLGNSLINLGLYEQVRQILHESGLELDELLEREREPGNKRKRSHFGLRYQR